MHAGRSLAAAFAALVLLSACGGAVGHAVVSDPPVPTLTGTPTTSPSATAPLQRHRRQHAVSSAAPTRAATMTAPAAPTHVTPAATHSAGPVTAPTSTSPKPTASRHPSPSPTAASCAGTAGSTTTIQEVSGDKFTPSAVSISRCDSVKAVYADSTGTPHTWTGPGWNSGAMSASSNSSYIYRFASTGTFHFVCSYHQSLGMTGTVTVS